jgi:transaldolase/glucose-6-phosphate isomerase
MNRVKGLEDFGQSVWLDFLSRELFKSGDLMTLIERDGLKGMTSNPSIFQKSIAHGNDYDDDIKRYAEAGDDVGTIFRRLSVKDIQTATDTLRPIYDATSGIDGFVSIEVSPYLAYDTQGTIEEARALWKEVNRPNLMVKIPGTEQGIPAIAACLGEGININITLLFAQDVYERVVDAYLSGLETLGRSGRLDRIASVASFFVSRIDNKADAAIEEKLKAADPRMRAQLEKLRGKIAIANAKLAYQYYKKTFRGARWDRLVALGARPQRLLWASTSTKNKAYPDTLYADALIGPDTVDTLPPETMDAFRDHGTLAATLEKDVDDARQTLAALAQAGISLDQITKELTIEGVDLFADAADKLYGSLAEKRTRILGASLLQMTASLGEAEQAVTSEIARWPRRATSGGSGPGTNPCGPTRTKTSGSAGSMSSRVTWQIWLSSANSPRACKNASSPTSCCLEWAARASARQYFRIHSAGFRIGRVCTCSIPPIPIRFARSKRRLRLPRPFSSWPRSRVRRSNPTCSRTISSIF